VKLLADMGVSMTTVHELRSRGHDVVHLREQGLHRLPDVEILAKARTEERTVMRSTLSRARTAMARYQVTDLSYDPDTDVQRTRALAGVRENLDAAHQGAFVDMFADVQARRVYTLPGFPGTTQKRPQVARRLAPPRLPDVRTLLHRGPRARARAAGAEGADPGARPPPGTRRRRPERPQLHVA
jgi:uncharacterized protein DUF5615